MKIRLQDLGKDGRDYQFDHETAELNEALEDFLQGQKYNILFHLKALSSKTFEMKGELNCFVPADCSKCSEAIVVSIQKKFHEILTAPQPEDRTGRYSKTPLSGVDDGISSTPYLPDLTFDLGDYFHELIGISLPSYPKHSEQEAAVCQKALKEMGVQSGPDQDIQWIEEKPSTFAALEGLKLKN